MMLTDSLLGSSCVRNRSVHPLRACALIGLLLFWSAPELSADTVTTAWDRNSESNIAGYILSYGTQSGTYAVSIDVGNVTTRQVVLNPGQRYYFVVQAYITSSQISPRSAEIFVDVGIVTTAPNITSLSPTSGSVGTAITIAGANFGATQGTSTVRFNGSVATPSSWSATGIVAVVPSGATTGLVTVTVGGAASNGVGFTVVGPAPSITSLAPTSGAVGTVATITGTNFGMTKGTSTVTFNGTVATPTTWSATSLVVPVPVGATTGNVVVTVGGVASNAKVFTVTGPASWTAQDIGNPALAGSASWTSGTFSVRGAGVDIWGTSDQFQFMYQTLDGDGEIVARVTNLQNTHAWAKAGVMIREDLTGGAPNAVAQVTAGNGMTFQRRVTRDGASTSNSGFAGVAPYWVRLVRTGNTFSGYYSATGTAWILMGSSMVPMSSRTYVGLAVTSHAPSVVTTGTFSNVSVTSTIGTSTAPSITTLAPTSGVAGTAVTITGSNFGATKGTSTVTFNGTLATPTTWAATSIVVPAPVGTTTGNVVVTVGGVASNGVVFTMSAPAAITLVQHRSKDGGTTTSSSLAFPANNGAGNFIAVLIRASGDGLGLTVTDTRANTYRQAARFTRGADHTGAIYYAENIGSGANTVTVSVAAASTVRFAMLEYAGVAASNALDGAVTALGSSTLPSSGTLTTTMSGDLLLGAITIDENVNVVAGTGYTIRESVPALPGAKAIAEDRMQASAGPAAATGTLSVAYPWGAAVAAFKPAASGPAAAAIASGTTSTGVASSLSPSRAALRTDDDYDGDGKTDVTAFTPSTGTWSILESSTGTARIATLGTVGDRPVPGDYDGDGKTDIAVYHPATGAWSIRLSSTGALTAVTWGSPTDLPVPVDYDGDGQTDLAIYRPSTGAWIILQSSTHTTRTAVWGSSADVPMPGDYDGDRKADLAVYRPTTGLWQILQSGTNTPATAIWGSLGDRPTPGDYDGDGKTDITVYQAATGVWSMLQSSTNTRRTVTWGSSSDVPVPGDYDGDGTADLAVFRPSTGLWQILQSSTNMTIAVTWGMSTDVPLP